MIELKNLSNCVRGVLMIIIVGFTKPAKPQFKFNKDPEGILFWSSTDIPRTLEPEFRKSVARVFAYQYLGNPVLGDLGRLFSGEVFRKVTDLEDLRKVLSWNMSDGLAKLIAASLTPKPEFTVTDTKAEKQLGLRNVPNGTRLTPRTFR